MKNLLTTLIITGLTTVAFASHATTCDTLRGTLTTRTLTADKGYVLDGTVIVPDGETLTINPGVHLFGMNGSSLIIDKGAQLQAIGKADSMIHFTSAQPVMSRTAGDWIGVALLGKANNNESNNTPIIRNSTSYYGGATINNDNSGTLRYVSIAYAGQQVMGDTYADALVLNSVGTGTTIDHVQIINSLRNGIQILGGTVGLNDIYVQNAKHADAVIQKGYQGTIEQFLGIKNSSMETFGSDAKGIAVYNNDDISYLTATPLTTPNINVFTLIGADHITPDQSKGLYFDNNGGGAYANGVVSGYDYGLYINDIYGAARTGGINPATLQFNYVGFVNNKSDLANGAFTFSDFGCSLDLNTWFASGCANSNNQEGSITLAYNNSIYDNYCSTAPTFNLNNTTDLILRADLISYIGVLQEDPAFTWAQSCALIDVCTAPLGRTTAPLMLYPNPGTDVIHIQIPSTIHTADASIRILNMLTGEMVYDGNANKTSIDIQHLPIGHYQIQLQDGKHMLQGKLFIER